MQYFSDVARHKVKYIITDFARVTSADTTALDKIKEVISLSFSLSLSLSLFLPLFQSLSLSISPSISLSLFLSLSSRRDVCVSGVRITGAI